MRQPEDDGCCDADGGHEGVGASVVACVDAAPIVEFAEHVLDLVTLAVEHGVVRDGHLSVGLRWDAEGDATLVQRGAELVGIVAPVGQQRLGAGEGIDHQSIRLPAFGCQLGQDAVEHAQAAPADEPVVDRLAFTGCRAACVACAVRAIGTSASRQRSPFLITKMMPLTIRRSSTRAMPCDRGKYGSIRRICASLNNQTSDNSSASSAPPLNQPIASRTSVLIDPEPKDEKSNSHSRSSDS